MTAPSIQKATRRQSKLRLGITGPSGSGKTFTALEIATGMGGKILVIDTESGSASLYADRFDFAVMGMEPPFSSTRFVEAIKAAEEWGADVIVVDSMTHEWAAEGGVLDKKNRIDAMGGNSYTNWGKVNPEHEVFIQSILQSKAHMICTLRSKQDYVLEDRNGKQVPKKVGMAPVARDSTEYEFTTVFDMAITHDCTVSKDRTGLFDGQIFKPSRKTGQQLIQWLNSGNPAKPEPPPTPASPPTPPPSGEAQGAVPAPLDKPVPPMNPDETDQGGMSEDGWNTIIGNIWNCNDGRAFDTVSKRDWKEFEKVMSKAQQTSYKIFGKQMRAYFKEMER